MTSPKLDSKINLQQLIGAVITIILTVVIYASSIEGRVSINERDIGDLKQLEVKMDNIFNKLVEIQLELKDKADR